MRCLTRTPEHPLWAYGQSFGQYPPPKTLPISRGCLAGEAPPAGRRAHGTGQARQDAGQPGRMLVSPAGCWSARQDAGQPGRWVDSRPATAPVLAPALADALAALAAVLSVLASTLALLVARATSCRADLTACRPRQARDGFPAVSPAAISRPPKMVRFFRKWMRCCVRSCLSSLSQNRCPA